MKTTKFLLTTALIAAIFSSCSKGDTGPAGPAGTNGTNGVANISSNIFSITPGSWSNPQTGEYLINISDGSITDASTDGVEVFISTDGTTWLGLPTTNLLVNGDQMEFAYQNGQISLLYLNSSTPSSTIDLKVVIIPPAVMISHPHTNWNNYSEVNVIMKSETTGRI